MAEQLNTNLVMVGKDGKQKAFALPSDVTVIGRRHDCDLYIPLMSVSRRHCQINRSDGKLIIRDLGSKAGTILNGKKIEQETPLSPGDRVTIGPVTFVLQINGKPEKIQLPAKSASKPTKQQQPQKQFTDHKSTEILDDSDQLNDINAPDDDIEFDDLDGSGSVDIDLSEL